MSKLEIVNEVLLELNRRPVENLENLEEKSHIISEIIKNIETIEKEVCKAVGIEKIPEKFSDILLYGATIKTSANPHFAKFNYWCARYNLVLSRLRKNIKNVGK